MSEEVFMPPVFQMGEHLDDDETLKLVRQTRLGLLDVHLKHGLMTDKEDFTMMNANLTALSGDAHRGKQLKAEEKSSEAMVAMAKLAAEELAKKMGVGLFTQQQAIDVTPHTAGLAEIHGMATAADGELFVGTDVRTYDEFNATVGAELDRKRRGEPETVINAESTDSP